MASTEATVEAMSGLAAVDAYLDEPDVLAPLAQRLEDAPAPVDLAVYARLMVLKYRSRLGYEWLRVEVSRSPVWRRFCRIASPADIPSSDDLVAMTRALGTAPVLAFSRTALATAGGVPIGPDVAGERATRVPRLSRGARRRRR